MSLYGGSVLDEDVVVEDVYRENVRRYTIDQNSKGGLRIEEVGKAEGKPPKRNKGILGWLVASIFEVGKPFSSVISIINY